MLPPELPHDMLLPSRHRQLLVEPAQHHHPVPLAFVIYALAATNRGARNEAIAMDAHEAVLELLLEPGQRLLEQKLARLRACGNVFQLRFQVDDVGDRNQVDASTLLSTEIRARAGADAAQRLVARWRGTARATQRRLEPRRAYRLEQIIHRVDFEGFDRVGVVRRREYDRRCRFELLQVARHFDAVDFWHADVEQDDVRIEHRNELERLASVG